MADMQEETLIEAAFRMAQLDRHASDGVLFHSDRGSQYTSDAYRTLLAQAHVTVSPLKGECVERASFQTRGQARHATFEYIECFYVRSVQPKLAATSEGMAGKEKILDNS